MTSNEAKRLRRIALNALDLAHCLSTGEANTITFDAWRQEFARGKEYERTPLPRRRNTLPDWVPEGMRIFTLPSSVGTSICAPSTACGKLSGTVTRTSAPSRVNKGCG